MPALFTRPGVLRLLFVRAEEAESQALSDAEVNIPLDGEDEILR